MPKKGYKCTPEHKEKMRVSGLRAWKRATPERRAAAGHYKGKKLTAEHAAKIGAAQKRSWTEDRKKKAVETTRGHWRKRSYRKKVVAAIREAHNSPESKEKHSKAAKSNWEKPAMRKTMSEGALARWRDEKFTRKATKSMRRGWKQSPAAKLATSIRVKEQWKRPGFREMMSKLMSARVKAMWEDPAFRKKNLRVLRSKKRRAKVSAGLLANSRGPHRESAVEGAVVNWARARDILAFKLDPKHYAGAPDRLFLIPQRKPVFIEFKRPDGKSKPSRLQLHIHGQIRSAGYEIHVCRSREEAVAVLEAAQGTAKRR
jgi:hypothetical protein